MKLFIIKLIIFISILLLILGVIEFRLRLIPNSYSIKRDCIINNQAQLRYLILGTSQAQYDLDPTIFDLHGCNLANANQDFYYDNQLVHKYVDRLPRVKTVILPVTYFSLGFRLADSDESWRQFFYVHFFQIQEQTSLWDLRQYSFISLYSPKTALGFLLHRFDVSLVSNNTSHGWFQAQRAKNIKPIQGITRARLHTKEVEKNNYSSNKYLLENTIKILNKHHIKVVLVMLPVSISYKGAIDKTIYQDAVKYYEKISQKYHIAFYNDFQDNNVTQSDFSDGSDHLNNNAATKFSKKIYNEI